MSAPKHIITTHKKSNYYIGICELHNELIHGFDESSSPTIKGHYLLMQKFSTYQKFLNHAYDDIEDDVSDNTDNSNIIDLYQYKYLVLFRYTPFMQKSHEFIRNYHTIIQSLNYIQPHIVECVYLPEPGGECIAIIKTFWLKIVQRTWKRIYKQRMAILKSIPFLRSREIGFQHTIHVPGIRGMLYEICCKN